MKEKEIHKQNRQIIVAIESADRKEGRRKREDVKMG